MIRLFIRKNLAATLALAAFSLFLTTPLRAENSILSFQDAKAAADSGDSRAEAIVAMHYSLGWQVTKNPEQAIDYALRSARSGNALGLFRMGAILRSGEGLAKNEQEGLKLQSEAVKLWNEDQLASIQNGDPYSLLAAGILFFQGKVINESQSDRYRVAAGLYQRAADSGFAPAQFNFAMCLIEGHGVSKDREAAIGYLIESAKYQYPLAQKWLLENGYPLPESGATTTMNPARNTLDYPPAPTRESVPPKPSYSPQAFEFKKRFAEKFTAVVGQLATAMAEMVNESTVSNAALLKKLTPGGEGTLADWMEQSFVAENLEAKQNETYESAISQDRQYAYESASFAGRILPLLAEKKFTDAKDMLLKFTASNPSPQIEMAVLQAMEPFQNAIEKPIAQSDELRKKSAAALDSNQFEEAESLLKQASEKDKRSKDSKDLSDLKLQEKKHKFDTDLGL
jgi:TPR repeat protein